MKDLYKKSEESEAIEKAFFEKGKAESVILAMMPVADSASATYRKSCHKSGVDYADLNSEAKVAVLLAINSWRPNGFSLRSWCYRKARTAIAELYRRELRHKVVVDDSMDVNESVFAVGRENDEELTAKLKDILTQQEYRILSAGHWYGASTADLARDLGVSKSMIYKLKQSGLDKVKQIVH